MLINPNGSPFYIFRHFDTVKKYLFVKNSNWSPLSLFLSDIRFTQKIFANNKIQFWRWRFKNIAVYSNFCCYIRTILRFSKEKADVRKQALPLVTSTLYPNFLDVISEVICVLLRRSQKIKKKVLAFVSGAISEH